MNSFSGVLTRLQAAIAVVAARERHLTVLLVAVWGRIGFIRTRLLRPLCRMLGIGVAPSTPGRKLRAVWQAPRAAPVMVVPAGLVFGPGGRLVWV